MPRLTRKWRRHEFGGHRRKNISAAYRRLLVMLRLLLSLWPLNGSYEADVYRPVFFFIMSGPKGTIIGRHAVTFFLTLSRSTDNGSRLLSFLFLVAAAFICLRHERLRQECDREKKTSSIISWHSCPQVIHNSSFICLSMTCGTRKQEI